MAVKLTGHQVEVVLSTLDGWIQTGAKIRREYKFPDFIAAAMFVTGVHLESEKMNHHPELCQGFNTVKIELTTHEVEGVSELDLRLAKKLDARARALAEQA
ncbi:4a-hydroxytetrahydrobiopterin dehydratase [bacterium]|nr:4a-hydroxytetrahydrobiopterin dehydratase [bacterium]